MAKSPQVPASVSTAIIAFIVGGILGYYLQAFTPHARAGAPSGQASTASGGSGWGQGRGGGGMGGFGGSPSPAADLARTVRNLNTVESVQGRGLTKAQSAAIAPILQKIKSTPKLSDAEAQQDAGAIDKILTADQHDALTTLQPQRGRGGGGGGWGGGGRGDATDNPFASDRNKEALDHLISVTMHS